MGALLEDYQLSPARTESFQDIYHELPMMARERSHLAVQLVISAGALCQTHSDPQNSHIYPLFPKIDNGFTRSQGFTHLKIDGLMVLILKSPFQSVRQTLV